jgi:hypothetical protein
MNALLIAIGTIAILIRVWIGVNVEPHHATWLGTYQALAHVFVGLIAFRNKPLWILFTVMIAVEVIAVILSRI